jgi:GNAT superfamily N-acetyltransferase
MPPDKATLDRLLRALPDVPRWVETRSMLLSGRCEVSGLAQEGELSFVVRDTGAGAGYASVVGRPDRDAITEAVAHYSEEGEVLAVPENRAHAAAALPGWRCVSTVLHDLGDALRMPDVPEGSARLLPAEEVLDLDLPQDLRSELRAAVGMSPVAVAFDGDRPVAFCYAASLTEGLWDVSIDTLEGHRRRGHAARCVALLDEHMRRERRRPVWNAATSNAASLGLAARLGFVPVDEMVVFLPPRNRRQSSALR